MNLEKIFKCPQCIFAIISPEKKANLNHPCVPSFCWIGPVVLEKKTKIWKIFNDDNRQISTRKAHFSLQLSWIFKEEIVKLKMFTFIDKMLLMIYNELLKWWVLHVKSLLQFIYQFPNWFTLPRQVSGHCQSEENCI